MPGTILDTIKPHLFGPPYHDKLPRKLNSLTLQLKTTCMSSCNSSYTFRAILDDYVFSIYIQKTFSDSNTDGSFTTLELVLESRGKHPIAADLEYFKVSFCFILSMVYCVPR